MYVTIEDTIMKLPTGNLLNIASNESKNSSVFLFYLSICMSIRILNNNGC